jgi:hypothetical protein
MQNLKVPVWLIGLTGVIFLFIVLERLYYAKVPVKIWGIELNQPPTQSHPSLSTPARTIVIDTGKAYYNGNVAGPRFSTGWEQYEKYEDGNVCHTVPIEFNKKFSEQPSITVGQISMSGTGPLRSCFKTLIEGHHRA